MKPVKPPAKPVGKPLSEAAATKRLKEAARDLSAAQRRGKKPAGKKPAAKKGKK